MRNLLTTLLIAAAFIGYSQVIVNKVDITKEVDSFEVWAFKKPFSNKESLFINFGQKKFRPHYYDHKTQRIIDDKGRRFEKGEFLRLVNYLKEQGFIKSDERPESIGEQYGRVITFTRVE